MTIVSEAEVVGWRAEERAKQDKEEVKAQLWRWIKGQSRTE